MYIQSFISHTAFILSLIGMIYCCKILFALCVVCNPKTLYLLYNYDNMFTTIIMEAWRRDPVSALGEIARSAL